jgi:hypothetical protein
MFLQRLAPTERNQNLAHRSGNRLRSVRSEMFIGKKQIIPLRRSGMFLQCFW